MSDVRTGGAAAGDPRFFPRQGPFSVADIAQALGIAPPAEAGARLLHRVAPLQAAGPEDVSFLDNRKYAAALNTSKAGAVVLHPDMLARVPEGCVALPTPEPYLAWARVAALFHPPAPTAPGVHPTAIVDPSVQIDPSVEIGPFAIIEAGVEIGPRVSIGAHCVIGRGVGIGADSRIASHCSVSHALLGERVRLFAGVRIGQDGFGFATSMTPTGPSFVSVPQLGRVLIEHDVEIGANSCIDRGSAQDTRIGAGTRIDNLVQIGHNVQVGRACVIVSQVGISGSAVLEDFVVLAGQVGVAGHVRIGRAARLGGQCGVMADLPGGAEYIGSPAMPVRTFFRQVASLKRLAEQRQGAGARAGAAGTNAAGGAQDQGAASEKGKD